MFDWERAFEHQRDFGHTWWDEIEEEEEQVEIDEEEFRAFLRKANKSDINVDEV